MTVKKFELIAQARKKPKGLERCIFVINIGTFGYLVFKNY